MSLFEINGTKIHAVDLNPEGDDPVVMIHGLFSSLAVYYLSIALKVSRRRRVILYDMRGHGLSERRDEGYTPGMLSGDLCDLLDTLKLPRADIVAYSYGTTVALHTALHHPERVCRLILIEAMFLNKARDTQLVVGEEANGTTGEVAGKEGGGGGGGAISESANDAAFEKGLAEYTASTEIGRAHV
jgi:pimeloyl-ACP methyl ester carboxylesterase